MCIHIHIYNNSLALFPDELEYYGYINMCIYIHIYNNSFTLFPDELEYWKSCR